MIYKTPDLTDSDLKLVNGIRQLREELSRVLQDPKRWTGFLRRNQLARNVQGSNTIEGFNVTFDDAVAVVEGEEVDVHTETRLAVYGYRQALTFILRLTDSESLRFNEELVKSLHYMMMDYNQAKHPGQWRPGPIFVRREPTGERVYEGPDADLVPDLMREFVEEVDRHDESVPATVRAAMAHLNLVMIHPFSDGNGRMGRAVQTFVLAREGILSPVFSSIEEYLGSRSNTDAYYSTLATVGQGAWHPENDAHPWVEFCLLAHLQQALTVKRRMLETAKLWNDLEYEIQKRGLHERTISALYEAAIGIRVRSHRYRYHADISAQVASKDLRVLVERDLLIPKGEKRGRYYIASPALVVIRDRNRQPRQTVSEYARQSGLTL